MSEPAHAASEKQDSQLSLFTSYSLTRLNTLLASSVPARLDRLRPPPVPNRWLPPLRLTLLVLPLRHFSMPRHRSLKPVTGWSLCAGLLSSIVAAQSGNSIAVVGMSGVSAQQVSNGSTRSCPPRQAFARLQLHSAASGSWLISPCRNATDVPGTVKQGLHHRQGQSAP